MTAISLHRIRDKIERRFPDYHEGYDARLWCLKKLWGNPDCLNGVGVFSEREEIRVSLKSHKQWHAEIDLASSPNGWHTFGTSYMYSTGGGGYAPSVSAKLAYPSRQEALDAAVVELIGRFEKIRDAERPDTAKQKDCAAQMISMLDQMLNPEPVRPLPKPKTTQMELFA